MMTDAPTGHFQSIVLRPHAGQFVIDELPAIVLCCAAHAPPQIGVGDHFFIIRFLCGEIRLFISAFRMDRGDTVDIYWAHTLLG